MPDAIRPWRMGDAKMQPGEVRTQLEGILAQLRKEACRLVPEQSLQPCSNPIEAAKYDFASNSRPQEPKWLRGLLKVVESALSHMCASPSRKQMFLKSYRFPMLEDEGGSPAAKIDLARYLDDLSNFVDDLSSIRKDKVRINARRETVEAFVRYICMMSGRPSTTVMGTATPRFAFLTGKYGEGKSFLVNYILSTMSHVFDEENVVAIKLDYTDYTTSWNLETFEMQVAIKTLRILRDAYYTKGKRNIEELSSFIADRYSKERWGKQILLDYLAGRRDLSTTARKEHAHDMLEAVRCYEDEAKDGYTFVYILDGVDSFYRDLRSEEAFRTQAALIASYLPALRKNTAMLITMRRETTEYFRALVNLGNEAVLQVREFRLFHVPIKGIVAAKAGLLREWGHGEFEASAEHVCLEPERCLCHLQRLHLLDELIAPNPIGKRKGLSTSSQRMAGAGNLDWRQLGEGFVHFVYEFVDRNFKEATRHREGCQNSRSSDKSGLDLAGEPAALNMLFASDNRSSQRAIIAIAAAILQKVEQEKTSTDARSSGETLRRLLDSKEDRNAFIKKNAYLAYEALLLNGHYYLSHTYKYGVSTVELANDASGATRQVETWGPEHQADAHRSTFLPSLCFHNDYFMSGQSAVARSREGTHPLLIKPRILQFYAYCSERGGGAEVKAAAKKLGDLFGYNPNWVISEIHALYSEQTLDDLVEGALSRSVDRFSERHMTISERGRFALDNLLSDYHYLVYAVDNLNVPSAYAKEFMTPAVSVRLSSWYAARVQRIDPSRARAKAIIKKAFIVMAYVELVGRFEELEKSFFEGARPGRRFSFDPSAKVDDIELYPRIRSNAIWAIRRFLGPGDFVEKYLLPELCDEVAQVFPGLLQQ